MAASGRSKWSMAPLHTTASKLPPAKGSASDQPRTQTGGGPSARALSRRAKADMRSEGSAPTTAAPARAMAAASWPKPLATSRMRRPAPGAARESVTEVIRWNRYSLSRVVPVGMTSLMSRSRSTTRTAGILSNFARLRQSR